MKPELPSRPASRRLRPAHHQARLVLGVSVAATALVYAVPFLRSLAYPLLLLSTLAHELGHGVAALVAGGSFHRLEIFADGSGVATWSGEQSRLRLAFVAAGGLVGPAFAAALGFWGGRTARGARRSLALLAAVSGVALVMVVRGAFAMLFVALFTAVLVLMARSASDELAQLFLIFLSVQLALSVFSRGDYLFTPVARTARGPMPSDVGQIASALLLPYWFWGFLCGALSVAVLIVGLRVFWRR
ncbi:MAG: M50 family metallopeptidase [Acidobacteriota bacterium]